MILHVEVTAEDIREGAKDDPGHCPIALALCRLLPGAAVDGWRVFGSHADAIRDGSYMRAFDLPDSAHQFVIDFDEGATVDPFAFDVEFNPEPPPLSSPSVATAPAGSPACPPTVATLGALGGEGGGT